MAEIEFEKSEWLTLQDYNTQIHIGFVKHGFVLAFHLLMRYQDKQPPSRDIYDSAMHQLCYLAGDTDTNCAIVGGLLGAYLGVDNIASEKLKKVLECEI